MNFGNEFSFSDANSGSEKLTIQTTNAVQFNQNLDSKGRDIVVGSATARASSVKINNSKEVKTSGGNFSAYANNWANDGGTKGVDLSNGLPVGAGLAGGDFTLDLVKHRGGG